MTELAALAGWALDFLLHLDLHLTDLVSRYGWQTHLILFIVIFWETGVVIWPFLPGDSLLFAAGSIAALPQSPLHLGLLFLLLSSAAILGDTANYWIGRWFGPKVFHRNGRFLKKKYLDQTQAFYDQYGAQTIVIARFVPIVRTFAPFVAGIGRMHYRRFIFFNVAGGILWNLLLLGAGYLFGGLEVVKNNFSLVILVIIFLSCLPMAVEFLKFKLAKKQGG
jgi:membrane-associated protein